MWGGQGFAGLTEQPLRRHGTGATQDLKQIQHCSSPNSMAAGQTAFISGPGLPSLFFFVHPIPTPHFHENFGDGVEWGGLAGKWQAMAENGGLNVLLTLHCTILNPLSLFFYLGEGGFGFGTCPHQSPVNMHCPA